MDNNPIITDSVFHSAARDIVANAGLGLPADTDIDLLADYLAACDEVGMTYTVISANLRAGLHLEQDWA